MFGGLAARCEHPLAEALDGRHVTRCERALSGCREFRAAKAFGMPCPNATHGRHFPLLKAHPLFGVPLVGKSMFIVFILYLVCLVIMEILGAFERASSNELGGDSISEKSDKESEQGPVCTSSQ